MESVSTKQDNGKFLLLLQPRNRRMVYSSREHCLSEMVWPPNVEITTDASNINKQFHRLTARPLVRPLEFRVNVSLPPPHRHLTSVFSAMIYRRGTVSVTSCRHCAIGNGRYPECVRILERDMTAYEEFLSGACANGLPMAATRCTPSKKGKSKFSRSLD